MATTYHNALQQLYVAYFNRPADKAGLDYWEGILEANGGNTAVVSASFAASAEYKAEYAEMENAEIVNQIYLNLFSRPAEPEGLVYWTNLLTAGTTTIDNVVSVISKAAIANNGADAVAFNGKVAVATAFTNALTTTELQNGYSGNLANEAAKELLSTIKTAADVTAATAPAKLAASIADVIDAATPFTLVSGLAALEDAQQARADFLAAADGEDNDTSATEASLNAEVAAIQADIGLEVTGYAAAKPAVAAALLQQEIADRAEELEDAQEVYNDALEAAGKVDGLVDAIANLAAAEAAETAAIEAQGTAAANLAAALAFFNAQNDPDATVAGDGTATGLIVLNSSGQLVLADGVKEADKKGVTALLNASKANEAAQAATVAAGEAVADAQFVVDITDLNPAAKPELELVGAGIKTLTPDNVKAPTATEILNNLATLEANAEVAAEIAARPGATQAQIDASTAADDALADFEALVDALVTDDALVANTLVDAVTDAEIIINGDPADPTDTGLQGQVDELAELVADLAEANANVAEFTALTAAINDIRAEFTEANLKAPVTLGVSAFATAGNDIFVLGEGAASTVNGFGDAGSDSLFIGTDYVLNSGALTTGNNSALEVFLIQDGANVRVVVEGVAFGSASAAEAEQVVTLTGVQVSELTFANGIITAA